MMQRLSAMNGKIELGYNVEIGYYDQENQNLDPQKTVLDELWDAYPTLPEQKIRSTLAWFKFFGDDVYKQVSVLSGGERARLTLSKLILSHMNLLILDEPTNHLDIDSKEALESALEAFDGTIIAVSHDRYFIEKLATRILEMKPGEAFPGDLLDFPIGHVGSGYTEFQEYKAARIAERTAAQSTSGTAAAPVMSSAKETYLRNKQNAADERKRRSRIERLHKQCTEMEAELESIEAQMSGDAATDYVRLAALDTRHTELEDALLSAYEELEELEG
jgi:ATP-binding cassette subfamily F protein 3